MGTYKLEYDETKQRLTLLQQGAWSYDEAVEFNKELRKYVNGRLFKSVLIHNYETEPFSSEVTEVWKENNFIPELMNAKVARLLNPAEFKMMSEIMANLPDAVLKLMPAIFNNLAQAEEFLDAG